MLEWTQLFVLFPYLNNFLFVFMLEKIRDNVNFHWCVATSETALEDYFSCSGLLKLFIEFENLICKVRYSNWTDYLIIFHKCIYCQSSVNNLLWEQTIRRVLLCCLPFLFKQLNLDKSLIWDEGCRDSR